MSAYPRDGKTAGQPQVVVDSVRTVLGEWPETFGASCTSLGHFHRARVPTVVAVGAPRATPPSGGSVYVIGIGSTSD